MLQPSLHQMLVKLAHSASASQCIRNYNYIPSPVFSFLSWRFFFFFKLFQLALALWWLTPLEVLLTRVMVFLLYSVTHFKQLNSHIRDPHPSMSKTFQSLLSKLLDETQNRHRSLFHSFLLVENGDFPKVKVS